MSNRPSRGVELAKTPIYNFFTTFLPLSHHCFVDMPFNRARGRKGVIEMINAHVTAQDGCYSQRLVLCSQGRHRSGPRNR